MSDSCYKHTERTATRLSEPNAVPRLGLRQTEVNNPEVVQLRVD